MRAGSAVRGWVERWSARVPAWARLVLAAAITVLGAVLLVRPTTSLGVLALLVGRGMVLHGVVELLTARGSGRLTRLVMAALWVAAGVFVLLWLGLTVRVLAVVVGVGLLAHGALLLATALRRGAPVDRRVADALFGAAGVVLGVLALAWPDITLLVVAVALGARLVMTGLTLAWATLRSGKADHSPAGAGTAGGRAPSRRSSPSPSRVGPPPSARPSPAAPPWSTHSTPRPARSPRSRVASCAPSPSPARCPTAPRPGGSSTRPPAGTARPPSPAASSSCPPRVRGRGRWSTGTTAPPGWRSTVRPRWPPSPSSPAR